MDPMLFRPRKLRRDSIAFDAVRSWLEQCQTLHEKECGRGSKTRQFSSLHMIDCHSLRVIPAPRDCEYVALSYVWGVMTEPLPELESGYLEFDKLPAVIKDAISVTKELGFGHIWIDRYCIPQNDEARHEQIQHMHSVDTNAELTIVAACSPHPGVGLAGVSRLRDHQIHIHLDEVDLVEVAFHRQKELVQNSIWNSRGWTFQEAMLSRRLLIFTDKMVQLQCRENTCLEALHRHPICGDSSSALHRGSNTHHLPSSLATIFPLAELFHEKDQYATVWDIIKTYNRRMLSFESDYLNAFLGVLNTCINVGSLAGHMWGLPLQIWDNETLESGKPSYAERLGQSMCWKGYDDDDRRSAMPSWSWVGWTGEPEQPLGNFRNPSLQIKLETHEGDIVEVDNYFALEFPRRPKLSQTLHVRAFVTIPVITTKLRYGESPGIDTIVSFQRRDGLSLKILETFPRIDFTGRSFLGILLGMSYSLPTMYYHVLIVEDKGTHCERFEQMQLSDNDIRVGLSERATERREPAFGMDVGYLNDDDLRWSRDGSLARDKPSGWPHDKLHSWDSVFTLRNDLEGEERWIILR